MNTKLLKEIDYFITADPESHSCGFKIYEVSGTSCDGEDTPLFGPNLEPFDPSTMEPDIHGSVKWDGCSNWSTSDRVMLHGCTRKHLTDVGTVLAACWDWSAELIPAWNSEVAQ